MIRNNVQMLVKKIHFPATILLQLRPQLIFYYSFVTFVGIDVQRTQQNSMTYYLNSRAKIFNGHLHIRLDRQCKIEINSPDNKKTETVTIFLLKLTKGINSDKNVWVFLFLYTHLHILPDNLGKLERNGPHSQ